MRAHILQKLNDLKTASGKSYEDAHEGTGYSTSTIHRWHKGESDPDLEQLTTLVEFYGGEMVDLFAEVGKRELAATQTIGYQGAEAMVEHYEARLQGKDALIAQLQQSHAEALSQERGHHDRSVAYLKEEIARLRDERDQARANAVSSASDGSGKKHTVFWVLVSIDALMSIALIIALMTESIL